MVLGQDIFTMASPTSVKDFSMEDVTEMKTIFMLKWHVRQYVKNQRNPKTQPFLMSYLDTPCFQT